jgi:hypothetical protein
VLHARGINFRKNYRSKIYFQGVECVLSLSRSQQNAAKGQRTTNISTFDHSDHTPITITLITRSAAISAISDQRSQRSAITAITDHDHTPITQSCAAKSECQPEESRNDADGGDGEPTTAMPHRHRQANTHRDQISRSGETPSL